MTTSSLAPLSKDDSVAVKETGQVTVDHRTVRSVPLNPLLHLLLNQDPNLLSRLNDMALSKGNALDTSMFSLKLDVPMIRVRSRAIHSILSVFHKLGIDSGIPRARLVHVTEEEDKQIKYFQLPLGTSSVDELPEALRELIVKESVSTIEMRPITLGYEYWTLEELLYFIVPSNIVIGTAFEIAGHLARLNLPKEALPYGPAIGRAILDKQHAIKTVVCKLDSIHHTFRFFDMQLLAGEDNTVVQVVENGCTFTFDYARVYWNSRLEHEHRRLVELFQPHEIICDMFAGVGPFAIPAARRGCVVYANDLNPVSAEFLRLNVTKNRVSNRVQVFNMDARVFPKEALAVLKEEKVFHHYVMNLPASAITFLDAFGGLYAHWPTDKIPNEMPMIHCHCFKKTDESISSILEQMSEYLDYPLTEQQVTAHNVRSVAPFKDMYCMSFQLPREVALRGSDRASKRQCTSINNE